MVGLLTLVLAASAGPVPERTAEVLFRGRPASSYGEARPHGAAGDLLAAEAAQHLPGLTLSPSLCRAAAVLAEARLQGAVELPPDLIELALRWAGSHDPTALATVIGDVPVEEVVAQVREVLQAAPEPFTHLGLAATTGSGDAPVWGVVLVRRLAEVEVVPTAVEPGTELRVVISLAPGLERPSLTAPRPDGSVARPEVRPEGTAWVARVGVGHHPGTLWLHLQAEGGRGEVMVAQMSVAVGGPPRSSWTVAPGPAEPPEGEVEAVEAAMVRLVNADRRRFGLPLLAPDPVLRRVARDHTLDMVRSQFMAHESPGRGGLMRRLEVAGYPVLVARENLSRADTVIGAQAALMASPGHRANILSADVTRLGVGVVAEPGLTGGGGYLMTQVFARPRVLPTGGDLRSQVRSRLEAARRLAGWPPLAESQGLDRAADRVAAASAAEGRLSSESLSRLRVDLVLSEVDWRSLRVDYHSVEGPEGVVFSEEALSPLTRTAGIGVARAGADGRSGPWVVVLLLLRR